jgi:ECF sigma factor
LPDLAPSVILTRMSEVTRILSDIKRGDAEAAGRLWPLVYDELRRLAAQKLAAEKPGQTLQATSLAVRSRRSPTNNPPSNCPCNRRAPRWDRRGGG